MMMNGRLLVLSGSAMVFALAYFGWKMTARGAYESAEYRVLESEGAYEVREYPDLIVATTETKVDLRGSDGSFMRLFRYISGGNEQEQKIAMTTPVFMAAETDETQGRMGFVLPKSLNEQVVPEPSDGAVQILKRTGGRFAVIRFSGRVNEKARKDAEAKLRSWMEGKGLVGEGGVESAGYDPPWTPGPMRRNEVLIRLQ